MATSSVSAWARIMESKAMMEQLAIVSKSRLFSRPPGKLS